MRWPIERLQPSLAWILGFLLLGLVGYLDYATGFELSVSVCYLLPVALMGWYAGRGAGIVGALAAAVIYYEADSLAGATYSSPAVPFWNATVKLGFFIFAGLATSMLRKALDREKDLARTDPLTEIGNRRQFVEMAEMEIRRAARYHHPFSVAYIDLDRFKEVNDRHGHEAGDRLLKKLGEALGQANRNTDILARMGGDEFAILMPETDNEAAVIASEKIRAALAGIVPPGGARITMSMGLTTWLTPPESTDEILRSSDALMYQVKTSGRDGVRHEVAGA